MMYQSNLTGDEIGVGLVLHAISSSTGPAVNVVALFGYAVFLPLIA